MSAVALNSSSAAAFWPRSDATSSRCAGKSCGTSTDSQSVTQNTKSTSTTDVAAASASPQQSALESTMASLRRVLSAVSGTGRLLDHVTGSAVVGLHAVSRQRGGIEIHTQEGDVVRIRFSDRTEVDAAAAQVSGDNGSASAQQLSISQHSSLKVSVQGNLNSDELKAINDVLTKVDSLAQDFFAGNVDAAFADAANLNIDSSQLADVAVRLSQRQSVSATAKSYANTPVADSSTVANEPSPPPSLSTSVAPNAVANDSNASPVPSSGSIAAPTTTASAAIESPANVETPAVSVATPDASSTLTASPAASTSDASTAATKSIVQYVAKLTTNLRVSDHDARLGFTFQAKLNVLIAAIQANKLDAATPSDKAVSKLQDVASKVATSV